MRQTSRRARDLGSETRFCKKSSETLLDCRFRGWSKIRVLFLADKDPKFGLDLANGVSESIWDPINPVPKTLLFRYLKRRAHHLSPDPNILKPKTKKLKFCHFQDLGQSPLQALLGPLGPYVAPEARFWLQTRVSGSGVPRRGVFVFPQKIVFWLQTPLGTC